MRIRIHTGKFREATAFLRASLGETPRNVWFTPIPCASVSGEASVLLHAQVNGGGVKRCVATKLVAAEVLDDVFGVQAYPVHYADTSRVDPCMGWATLTLFKPGAQLEYEKPLGEDIVKLGAIVEHPSPYPFPDMMRHEVKASGSSDIKNLQYFMAMFEIIGMNVVPRMRYFSGVIHVYARDEKRMILAELAVENATGGMWDSSVPVSVLELLKTSEAPLRFNFERPGKLEITRGDDLYFAQESTEYNPGFDYQGVARQICDFERCATLDNAAREYIGNMEADQVVLIKAEPGTLSLVPIVENPEEPPGNYQVSDGVSQLSCGYTKAPFVSVIRAEYLRAFSVEIPVALWGTPSPASPFLLSNGRVYLASYVFVTPDSLAGLLGDGMEVEKKVLLGYAGDPRDVYQEAFRGPEESSVVTHPTAPGSEEVSGHAALYLAEVPGRRFKHAGGVGREALGMHMHEFSVQHTFSHDVVDRLYVEQVWPELQIFVWYEDVWTLWQHFRDPEGQEETDGADIPKKTEGPREGTSRPARAAVAPVAPEAPEEKDSESPEIALEKSVENPINNIGESTVSAPEAPVQPKEEPVAYLLVDGHYVTRRDFHVSSLMKMRGPNGIRTGLIFSFLRELRKLIRVFNPARVIAVWDHDSAAWRRELLPEYRVRDTSKIPDEELQTLHDQRAELMENLKLVGVRSIQLAGQEADDVLALIAASVQGRTIIASNDSDFEQLVDGRVQVYKMKKGHLLVEPTETEELVAIKAVVGEATDKIPGIPGCGGKSMAKLVEEIKAAGAKVTFDEIKARAKGHSNYRVRRIVENKDGTDPWEIVKRNRQIIDLKIGMRKIPTEGMVQALSIVSEPIRMEPIAFGEWVRRLGAHSILKEMSDWQRSFGTLA